jgi:hypothetical protein
MAVRWIQRNASGSLRLRDSCRRPLARSTALRVVSWSVRSPISCSSAVISANRLIAISMAGTRSEDVKGLTR